MYGSILVGTGLDVPFGEHDGAKWPTARREQAARAATEVIGLRRKVLELQAKYDAAQTSVNNENHWANADYLDPHAANSWTVRRKLRARSRYEVIENNPYLKGTILTLCNDFVKSGPKLKIQDPRIKSEEDRQAIEAGFMQWAKSIKLRNLLWRMRMAKVVDGEAFAFAYQDRDEDNPLGLNFYIMEADRIASQFFPNFGKMQGGKVRVNEVDGVRFDKWERPTAYYALPYHPGADFLSYLANDYQGEWVDSRFVVHWFRQDRGWLRGIPETTPSLPLCALLRRYTLAVVRAAEVVANFSAVLETEGPPGTTSWVDENGNIVDDDPFDVFPMEMGMITKMPWGHKLKQLQAEQPTTMYDKFVNALLREIIRPLMAPFNIAAGSSAESNMASAVVDSHIYISGQDAERFHCEDHVLSKLFKLYWFFACRTPGYLAATVPGYLTANPVFYNQPPLHAWNWDRVGLQHTDPQKVSNSLATLFDGGHLTDRDIQEKEFNRSVEVWRDEKRKDVEFRKEIGLPISGQAPPQQQDSTDGEDGTTTPSDNPPKKAKPKRKAAAEE